MDGKKAVTKGLILCLNLKIMNQIGNKWVNNYRKKKNQ